MVKIHSLYKTSPKCKPNAPIGDLTPTFFCVVVGMFINLSKHGSQATDNKSMFIFAQSLETWFHIQAKVSFSCAYQAGVITFLSPSTILSLLSPLLGLKEMDWKERGVRQWKAWAPASGRCFSYLHLECCWGAWTCVAGWVGAPGFSVHTVPFASSCRCLHWTCSGLLQVNKNKE